VTAARPRVGLIGTGYIAHWRARALRAAGFEITAVGSRPGSKRLRPFAAESAIPRVFDDWREMLRRPEHWDCLAICTWPDGTPEVLSAALDLEVPTLVEKPVAWASEAISDLCRKPHDRVIVGYNRRAYPAVWEARRLAQDGPPLVAHLTLPKDVFAPAEADPNGNYLRLFFESVSALGIDVARYVLGDLRIASALRLRNPAGNLYGFAALLSTERGDVLQVTGNLGAAANFALTLNWPGRRFELLPFEVGSEYAGLEVVPPSAEYPIARYMPTLLRRIQLEGADLVEKPGFVAEAEALRGILDGDPRPEFAATLEDAAAVTRLCEGLTGVRYASSDEYPNPFAS
jgi:predicted dehydrogenase